MKDLNKTIKLHCTFCHSEEFAVPYEGYSPPGGTFVVCSKCGKENDFTSLLIIAKAKGLDIATDYANQLVDEMKKEFKNSFRNSNHIKIK